MDGSGCPKLGEYRSVLMDIAVGDTSACDLAALDEARRHAYACPHCRAELESSRRLVALLKPPRLPDDVVAELGAQLQANLQRRIVAWERRRRLLRWSAALCAVAAVALVALAFWPHRGAENASPGAMVAGTQHPALATRLSPSPAAATQASAPARRPTRVARLTVPAPQPITPELQKLLAEAARLREEGRRNVQARHYDKAEELLRKALALMEKLLAEAPDGEAAMAALYEQYRCHQLLGEYLARESCFRSYLRAVRERDGDEAAGCALVDDAGRLIRDRDLEAAGRRLERALALCPTGRVALAAHVLTAFAAEREGLVDLAYSQYHMALGLGPPPELAARMYRSMISTATRNRKFDLALEHAEKLCALPEEGIPASDRVVHHWLLARLYAHKGRTAKAVRVLRGVISQCGPQHTELARLELRSMAEKAIGLENFE